MNHRPRATIDVIIVKAFDKNEIDDLCGNPGEIHFLTARLEVLSRIRQNLVEKIAEIDTKIVDLKREGAAVPGHS